MTMRSYAVTLLCAALAVASAACTDAPEDDALVTERRAFPADPSADTWQEEAPDEVSARTAACQAVYDGCMTACLPYCNASPWDPIAGLQCLVCTATCSSEAEACDRNTPPPPLTPPTPPGPDTVDVPDARTWCTGEPVGGDAPEGSCQDYYCGGTSGVHFYTCCNFPNNSPCAGQEFDGASNGNYCGTNGENNGAGRALGASYPLPVGGCATMTECDTQCLAHTIQVPGMCWSYTLCLAACTAAAGFPGAPFAAFDGSNVDYSSCSAGTGPDDCTCSTAPTMPTMPMPTMPIPSWY